MDNHVDPIVILNPRPLAVIKCGGNDVNLVAISNQATCQTLGKACRSVNVRSKGVAS
jgi:hypothetical protein